MAEVPDENCTEKRQARVQLQTVPESMGSTTVSSGEDAFTPLPASRPFAILLRLRVTEIVAGIVTVLLGAVACLETATRPTLGLGIPVGVLTVLSAVAHIQAIRREYTDGLLPATGMTIPAPGLAWITRIPPRPLDALRPLLPTLACVLACLLLLALSFMSAAGREKNKQALGVLQAATAMIILSTEATVWTCRWHWVAKMQLT